MSAPLPTSTDVSIDDGAGRGQEQEGISLETFIASLAVAAVTFGVELLVFVFVRRKLQRIYEPRTYLVPEKRRTRSAGNGLLAWLKPIFKTSSNDFIAKSGLDAYFFLRYLLMLLKIFGLLAVVILPILLPINYVGGRGESDSENPVRGLDKLAWTNISVTKTNRYWAHLWLAIYAILVFCYMFFRELRVYIRLRQAYLTSPQHRLRASATTVLVTSIPHKWLSIEKLLDLYDILPGGVRNIWINRDFDELAEKVEERDNLARMLERAETDLIRTAKKRHLKEQTKAAKKAGGIVPENKDMSEEGGVSSGDPHQIPRKHNSDVNDPPNTKKNAIDLVGNAVGQGLDAVGGVVGGGVGKVAHGIRGLGRGIKGVIPGSHNSHRRDRSAPAEEGETADPEKKRRGSHGSSSSSSSDDSSDDERRLAGDQNHPGRGSTLQALEKRRRSSASRSDVMNEKTESTDRSTSHGRNWKSKLKGHTEDDERPFAAGSPISPTQPSRPGTAATQDGSRFHHLNPVAPIMNLIKGDKHETVYPPAYDPAYENDDYGEPVWKKYLTDKDRPTHRLPLFSFLPSLPLIGQKVDTIHYCRKEVARLNVEIEQDQQEPEKFPLMNSAFIQFNNQVAAHMACQSVNHHIPQQMAPRYLEVNPNDVLWENMRIKWWERYLRSMLVSAMVAGLIIGWAFPVGFVGLISQVDYLQKIAWLSWIERIPNELLSIISGVLPPLGLAILMALLPVILRTFAKIQGLHTGMSVELAVQGMYFAFLFVQVFLVVSISSGITATIKELRDNPASAAQVLATNLPKASNFFFSYLLIQAFAQSGGALLQIGSLAVYYLLSPFFDVTARQKWARQTNLTEMKWGTFFPVYTNLACIGLVYSVISPLILIFNMFTFGLFWIVYRYNLLFVNNFKYDTGGLLFPRAINQLFTGIYVMELCLIGLFFLVRDAENRVACSAQGGIMVAVLALTVLYQRALNKAFGPLITYLPITLEDEAAARDKLFAKEHDVHRRLTVADEAGDDGDVNAALAQREAAERAEEIELEEINNRRKSGGQAPPKKRFSFKPQKKEKKDHWSAANPADTLKKLFPFTPSGPQSQEEKDLEAAEVADRRRKNQAEFALFDDIPDEIEDLSPEERDRLVSRAFQHSALRAKRPVIWIPRDDLGIADDEIWRTQRFSKHIWVSNEYAGLDGKARVTYKRSPPDFDARDLVDL